MAENKVAEVKVKMKAKMKEEIPAKGNAGDNSAFFEEVMAFLVLSVVFISLFWQGLLHEWQSIPVVIVIAVLSIIIILKSNLRHNAGIKDPFIAAVYFILVIATLLSLTQAAYIHDAVYSLCKNSALFLLIIAVKYLNDRMDFNCWLQKTMIIAGVIAAWFALDAVWGGRGIALINMVLNGGALQEGQRGFLFSMITGDRPGSLFQYPNTAAAFLITAWFMAIHRQIFISRTKKAYKAGAFFYTGTTFLIFLAFVLTISRGMYLIGALALILYIFLLPQEKRIRAILSYIIGIVPAALIGILSFSGGFLRNIHTGIAYGLFILGFSLCGYMGLKIADIDVSLLTQKKKEAAIRGESTASQKRKWLLVMSAVVVAAFVFAGIAWNWTRPFRMIEDGNLVKFFSLKEAGEYTLEIKFSQDIDHNQGETFLSLSKQNRQEMMQRSYSSLISQNALNWQGYKSISQAFVLEENDLQLQLNVRSGQNGQAIESVIVKNSAGAIVERIKLARRILPNILVQRIETALNPQSAYERFSFYLDALRIFLEHPLTGVGGKGWGYMYQRYQRYEYIANDVHSYGVQLAVENGIGGIIVLTGFLAALVLGIVNNAKTKNWEQLIVLAGAGLLFLHSVIDFDCFYYGIQLVMALFFSQVRIIVPAIGKKNVPQNKHILNIVVVLCAICACFFPFQFRRALSYYSVSSYISDNDRPQAVLFMEKAARLDPFTPKYKVLLAQQILLNNPADEAVLEKADSYAEAALRQGRNDSETLRRLVEYYSQKEEYEKAYKINRILVGNSPLNSNLWTERGNLVSKVLERLDGSDQEERQYWLTTGLNIRREMKEAEEGKWIEIKATKELDLLFEAWKEEIETS